MRQLYKNIILVPAAMISWLPASAASINSSSKIWPNAGQSTTASIGNPIAENSIQEYSYGYILDEDSDLRIYFSTVTINKGTPLFHRSSDLGDEGCLAKSLQHLERGEYQICYSDANADGIFDRARLSSEKKPSNLRNPVRYSSLRIPQKEFKRVWTYLGSTKDSLKISYREFVNDMARPAFTEEYSIPLGEKFPQKVRFKNIDMTVLGIDGSGISYSLDLSPSS